MTVYYSSFYQDPAKHVERQEDYKIGCRGCLFNQQTKVEVGENRYRQEWRCGAHQSIYPNGSRDICSWWRK